MRTVSRFEARARAVRKRLRRYPALQPVINKVGVIAWKQHLRSVYRQASDSLTPRPDRLVHIDPSAVKLATWGSDISEMTGTQLRYSLGTTKSGSWDRDAFPIDEHPLVRAAAQRFVDGVPWEESDFVRDGKRSIDKGQQRFRIRTLDDLETSRKRFDELFDSISTKGYRTQAQLGVDRPWDEIILAVGRTGDLILVDGGHRFAIARALELDDVPALISTRHSDWEKFSNELRAYIADSGGMSYQPLIHPDLADVPFEHDEQRAALIRDALPISSGTLLDVGANYGYFCHEFEKIGFECTAVERSEKQLYFLEGLRNALGRKFQVVRGSVLEMDIGPFDVVLALNIFHHFLKTEESFNAFVDFLRRLECRYLVLETHLPTERQMADAYKNLSPNDFAAFVAEEAGLGSISTIGEESGRSIYLLSGEG